VSGDEIEKGDGLFASEFGCFQCQFEGRLGDYVVDSHCDYYSGRFGRSVRLNKGCGLRVRVVGGGAVGQYCNVPGLAVLYA
jgi:hypothetical protein